MSLEKTETKHDNEFVKSTLDPTLFQIEDVANDNACFYRAFSNCLNYSSSSLSLNEIKDLKFYGNYKPIEEVYENALWGFYSERQDRLARYLQGKSYRWVAKNYSKQLEEYGMDIGTMILLTHEIDIEEYLDLLVFSISFLSSTACSIIFHLFCVFVKFPFIKGQEDDK